jgi:hypothetical protein
MTRKSIIRLLGIACMGLIFAFSIPLTLVAGGKDKPAHDERGDRDCGCKLQGVWILGGPTDWYLSTFTFQGTGDNEGTYVVETINDLGFAWANPNYWFGINVDWKILNAHYTVYRGIWVKTGPNTYKTKAQGYVVQRIETGNEHFDQTALVFQDSLTITLKDCNTAEIENQATPYYLVFGYVPGSSAPVYTWTVQEPIPIKRLLIGQEYPFPQ